MHVFAVKNDPIRDLLVVVVMGDCSTTTPMNALMI
jgi:hypothetical protein